MNFWYVSSKCKQALHSNLINVAELRVNVSTQLVEQHEDGLLLHRQSEEQRQQAPNYTRVVCNTKHRQIKVVFSGVTL